MNLHPMVGPKWGSKGGPWRLAASLDAERTNTTSFWRAYLDTLPSRPCVHCLLVCARGREHPLPITRYRMRCSTRTFRSVVVEARRRYPFALCCPLDNTLTPGPSLLPLHCSIDCILPHNSGLLPCGGRSARNARFSLRSSRRRLRKFSAMFVRSTTSCACLSTPQKCSAFCV